jgi:hypothetical protein
VKARRIIIDGVKDHIIPHLSRKKTAKDMWKALTKLYQSNNLSRKMLLGEKLGSTKMAKGDSVATYLTKFTQIRDELAAVGETVDETELVRTSLNGFTKQWDVFVQPDGERTSKTGLISVRPVLIPHRSEPPLQTASDRFRTEPVFLPEPAGSVKMTRGRKSKGEISFFF